MILRTNLLMDGSAVSGFVLLCIKMKLSEAKAQVLSSWVSIHWTDSSSHFRMSSQLCRKPFTEKFHGFFPVAGLDLHFPSHPMLQRARINFHLSISISPFWTIAVFTQGINTLRCWKTLFLHRHGYILILFEFRFTPPADKMNNHLIALAWDCIFSR